MKVNVVTIFPDMFKAVSEFGITRQAVESGALKLSLFNPRDYTDDVHRSVDDRPYGGGPGMVMKPEPMAKCIDDAKGRSLGPVIYLTPQGSQLNQDKITALSKLDEMTLVSGRYEGVDERVIASRIDEEVSIGDYVLAGGELPAMVVIDAVSRLLPDVLGNDQSALQDSFSNGLLDWPQYTRPDVFEGKRVPDVLLSGNHRNIDNWRKTIAKQRTKIRRPDLIKIEPKES